MHHSYLAQLDKNWLKESISAKQDSLNDVNGALTSEVISDLFVLGSGSLTAAFAVASQSLVPLALNPLPVIQLGLAYKTIKSLMNQRSKIQNDLHVLNAILHMDEETPENITSMVRGYLEIHGDPETEGRPTHMEVKELSPAALSTIQKNFRQKKSKTTPGEKVAHAAGFLKSEFTHAVSMVGKTLASPVELGKSIGTSYKNIKRIYDRWELIEESMNSKTLRETYNMMIRRARREEEMKSTLPKELDAYFNDERKKQLYYLHQQQAALRTVSRSRVDTAIGYGACTGIITIALWTAVSSNSLIGLAGSLYTIAASLPSLKVLGKELDNLTKTVEKYSPRVDRAAAEFLMGMPGHHK